MSTQISSQKLIIAVTCLVGGDLADKSPKRRPGPQELKSLSQENKKRAKCFFIQSSWATKVSEIGQQALVGADGAEQSQGCKDHGIQRPCLEDKGCYERPRSARPLDLPLMTHLTNASDRSASRTLPKPRLTYLPQVDRMFRWDA